MPVVPAGSAPQMLFHRQVLALTGSQDQEHPGLRGARIAPAVGQGGVEQ